MPPHDPSPARAKVTPDEVRRSARSAAEESQHLEDRSSTSDALTPEQVEKFLELRARRLGR